MKIAGIIAEYNPIHAGHEYHIAETKKRTGADLVIVCMSGSYTQRGIPAFFDKFTRTRDALAAGADIVLEMPLCASLGSAEIFARGGVSLLSAAGADLLSFGSECGNIDSLSALVEILLEEPKGFSQELKSRLKTGLSYPKSYAEALQYCLSSQAGDPADSEKLSEKYNSLVNLLSSPNNTLALEYIKAVKKLGSNMDFFTIARKGMGYNELFDSQEQVISESKNSSVNDINLPEGITDSSEKAFPSSSALREAIKEGKISEYCQAFSESSGNCTNQKSYSISESGKLHFLENDDFTLPLASKLLSYNAATLAEIYDINNDMADRIVNSSRDPFTFTELAGRIKSKTLTHARINRCLYHILFDIKESDCKNIKPAYIRVLGIKESAGNYLKNLKANAPCPVITRLSKDRELLSSDAKKALKKELLAYELYRKVWYSKYGDTLPSDYKTMEVFR